MEDPPSRLGASDPAGRELRLVLLSALCGALKTAQQGSAVCRSA